MRELRRIDFGGYLQAFGLLFRNPSLVLAPFVAALIGVGIALIGVGTLTILHHDLTLGIALSGVGIATIGGGIWILRAPAIAGGTTEAGVGGTGAGTGPPAGAVKAADPPPPHPMGPESRIGRHARPD